MTYSEKRRNLCSVIEAYVIQTSDLTSVPLCSGHLSLLAFLDPQTHSCAGAFALEIFPVWKELPLDILLDNSCPSNLFSVVIFSMKTTLTTPAKQPATLFPHIYTESPSSKYYTTFNISTSPFTLLMV